ncbi:hypothetical protein N9C85_01585 [Synechococcus sp. AH-224-I15]|nr:hypothetical protein [Synechococcus sp. AH-224-I15]
MNTIQLPTGLLEATIDTSDPLKRYAALQVCWGMNPMDVTCRDLLVPGAGNKNALPVPDESDWPIVLQHKHFFEHQINQQVRDRVAAECAPTPVVITEDN